MCYDIKASLEAQLNRAKRRGDKKAVEEILKELVPLTDLPLHHASGFSHPKLLIYTDRSPDFPEVSSWGLVPHWVKDNAQLKKLWNNTLNARGETIFEKPSFREAAKNSRCIIYIDGFYEHHHFKGNTYPFFIHSKYNRPIALAGLWSEWYDDITKTVLNTFTIVTTTGNSMMAKIHNNPKLKEPRMPVILPTELEEQWLNPVHDNLDKQKLETLITAFPKNELEGYTVGKLRGKEYKGNIPEISNKLDYKELQF
ncbi:SOS response-associated peptidase [Flavobacteriaceae bacterium KMM 6897]|nr:SOS response-associated peptidase [Flavobacteriaceae bacterium KMM 6897]